LRFVLDQNIAQKQELEDFLAGQNSVIVTDDFIVEPFKSPNPNQILDFNTRILKRHTDQFEVALDIGELMNLELSQGYPVEVPQIISAERTETVRNSFSNPNLFDTLKDDAKRRIEEADNLRELHIRPIASNVRELMIQQNTLKLYQHDSLKRISDIAEAARGVMAMIFEKNQTLNRRAFESQLSVNLVYVFCLLWRTVDWGLKAGFDSAKSKIKGDPFDLKYVTISAFFDGILTEDQWLHQCRKEMLTIL
jgi:hypothetical protein